LIVSNLITNEKSGPGRYFVVDDAGLTQAVSAILLAGSDMATTAWERELMTWFAEHDQSVMGPGLIGFDLDEIAWQPERFQEQQGFLIRVIDAAMARHRWESLRAEPALAPEQLRRLRELVQSYRVEYVEPAKRWVWNTPADRIWKCPVHNVYCHGQGCQICNDR
jgi:hypothetical protein